MKCRLAISACGVALVAGLVGCPDPDPRIGQLASQVVHDQAQQNVRIAEGSRAIAEGSQQLVTADAQARRDLIDLQQDLRLDQTKVAQQRDALEVERKAIAGERQTKSAIQSSLVLGGLILACLSPLVLAGISLLGLWREPSPEEEGQILVEQLAAQVLADTPLARLPAPPRDPSSADRLPHSQPGDLPR